MKKRQLKITHFSKEDSRYWEKFPWALIDTETDAVIDFFDTQEDAQAVLDELNQASMVENGFRDWVRKTAQEAGVEQQKVLDIVRECELGE